MPSTTFQIQLSRWDALNTNLKPRLQELPELGKVQKQLEETLAEGLTLAAQQNQLTAALRDLVVRRNELEQRGTGLRQYVEAALRHELGPKSMKLVEFDVRPRGRRRKPASETTSSSETPTKTGA